jgi:hypothetical protein
MVRSLSTNARLAGQQTRAPGCLPHYFSRDSLDSLPKPDPESKPA